MPDNKKCFFCGHTVEKQDNHYDMCGACRSRIGTDSMVVAISAVQPDDKRPPITTQDGTPMYPTGDYLIMKPDGVKATFRIDPVPGGIITLIDTEYKKIVDAVEAARKDDA